jgi:hypothetical protein
VVVDTFSYLTDSDHLPGGITLFLTQDDSTFLFSVPNLDPDSWYMIPGAARQAEVLFSGWYVGLEEDPIRSPGRAGMAVSPSIVTGQMMVRLQRVGTGRPSVQIHDAVGNLVRLLDCAAGPDGTATATWKREDEYGRIVPEGVYFCRHASGDAIAVRKVLVAH